MLRVVLDTNQLISGLLKKNSLQAKLIDAWKNQKLIIIMSDEIEREFETVIRYKKFKKYSVNEQDIKEILWLLKTECIRIKSVHQVEIQLDDLSDEKFLSAAVSGEADFIVTGDKKLLDIVSYKAIKIITAVELNRIIAENYA